jgi:hypothetical protein
MVTEQVEAAFRPAGGSWSAPVAVSDRLRGVDSLRLGMDSEGYALAAWSRTGDGGGYIRERTKQSGTWQAPNAAGISDATGGLDLEVDESGNAVIAYLTSGLEPLDCWAGFGQAFRGLGGT